MFENVNYNLCRKNKSKSTNNILYNYFMYIIMYAECYRSKGNFSYINIITQNKIQIIYVEMGYTFINSNSLFRHTTYKVLKDNRYNTFLQ